MSHHTLFRNRKYSFIISLQSFAMIPGLLTLMVSVLWFHYYYTPSVLQKIHLTSEEFNAFYPKQIKTLISSFDLPVYYINLVVSRCTRDTLHQLHWQSLHNLCIIRRVVVVEEQSPNKWWIQCHWNTHDADQSLSFFLCIKRFALLCALWKWMWIQSIQIIVICSLSLLLRFITSGSRERKAVREVEAERVNKRTERGYL